MFKLLFKNKFLRYWYFFWNK